MGAKYRAAVLILAMVSVILFGGGNRAHALTTTTYQSTDVPKAIPDPGKIISTIEIPCSQTITDVNVQLDISHTYDWDLGIFLIAPDGTKIELSTDNGRDGDNYSGTIFDDAAPTSITAGTAPFPGSYQPEGNLSELNDKGTSGIWILEVRDKLGDQVGILNSWSLIIESKDNGIFPSTDVPKAIPDHGMITSTIPVCTARTIIDLDVQLDISHPRDEDLDITLIAPDGTRVELSTDNGEGGFDYSWTTFDDEAKTAIITGTAPFSGMYRPEEPLSRLNGMAADGTWSLEVGDDSFVDSGIMNAWNLRMKIDVAPASYKVSTYVDKLPAGSSLAALTADLRSGAFYYTDFSSPEGLLRKIGRDRTVSDVTSDFTPHYPGTGNRYSTSYSDIQFLRGDVWVPLGEGELVRIDTATGTTSVEHSFVGFGDAPSIAAKGTQLLVSSGDGPALEIQSYDSIGGSTASLLDVTSLPFVLEVEYDPVYDKLYFWSESIFGNFYQMDFGSSTYIPIPGIHWGFSDFAVTPDGKKLAIRDRQGEIKLVSIADGSTIPLLVGMSTTPRSRSDMLFAPSTDGGGCSLFIGGVNSIREISGFNGNCGRPFPWPLVVGAIAAGKKADVQPQWGTLNTVCCEYSNGNPSSTTFSLTSGGVSRTSSLASCSSEATFEGSVVSTAGSHVFSWSWSSPGCGRVNGNFSYTLAKGMVYLFVAEFEAPNNIVIKVYATEIKTTASASGDSALNNEELWLEFSKADMQLVETIPLGTLEGMREGSSCKATE